MVKFIGKFGMVQDGLITTMKSDIGQKLSHLVYNGTLLCVARHSRHFQSSTDFSAVLHIANVMVSCFVNQIVKFKNKKNENLF